MLRWDSTGESFYITNIQEFTKALPHYFKAKSFGSFVRQLNMYHFFKVRGQAYKHEFRHPFFRRDAPESLKYIRRKQVNKIQKDNSNLGTKKGVVSTTHMLNMKMMKMEEVLGLMTKQNKDLASINDQMSEELGVAKIDLQSKTKDLFGLMAHIIAYPSSDVSRKCKEFMSETNFQSSELLQHVIRTLCQKQPICLSVPQDMSILLMIDGLINIYHNSNQKCERDINELSVESVKAEVDNIGTPYLALNSPIKKDIDGGMSVYSPRDNFNPNTIDVTPVVAHFASPLGKSPSCFYGLPASPALEFSLKMQYMTLDDMRYEVFINNSCNTAATGEEERKFVARED